jgi:hypothetical protein
MQEEIVKYYMKTTTKGETTKALNLQALISIPKHLCKLHERDRQLNIYEESKNLRFQNDNH